MNSRTFQGLGYLLLLLVGNAFSQNSKPPPLPPLPPQPTSPAFAYSVQASPLNAESPGVGVHLLSAEVIRVGSVRRETHVYSDQTKAVYFSIGHLSLVPDREGSRYAVFDGSSDSFLRPFESTDFSGLAWLDATSHRGLEKLGDRPAHVFSQTTGLVLNPRTIGLLYNPSTEESPLENQRLERQAWIDAETGRPLQLIVGPMRYTFQMLPAPTGDIPLPPAAREALQRYEKVMQTMTSSRTSR
ncbi:MAG: hypothetical protein SNJ84_00780 [Verrucomicrobiia bacterium]